MPYCQQLEWRSQHRPQQGWRDCPAAAAGPECTTAPLLHPVSGLQAHARFTTRAWAEHAHKHISLCYGCKSATLILRLWLHSSAKHCWQGSLTCKAVLEGTQHIITAQDTEYYRSTPNACLLFWHAHTGQQLALHGLCTRTQCELMAPPAHTTVTCTSDELW